MDLGTLLTGLGGGGVLVAGLNAVVNRRKLGADAAQVLTKAATELLRTQTEEIVKPLQEKVHELEAEVDTLRATVRETTAELETCRADRRAVDAELEATRERERAKDDLIAQLTRSH